MASANWTGAAGTGDWNTGENWSTGEMPGSEDTAYFGASSQAVITFSSAAEVKRIEFNSDAPIYHFEFGTDPMPALQIKGEVVNHSGNPQHFSVKATGKSYTDPQLKFSHQASAGGDDMHYYAGPTNTGKVTGSGGGDITFFHEATAGSAVFVIKSGEEYDGGQVGAEVAFTDKSTAGSATFEVYGGTGKGPKSNYGFANAVFHEQSNAGRATFWNKGGTISGNDGGNTQFYSEANAADARFYNEGGTLKLSKDSNDQWANGGDTAFDGTSNGGSGQFYNYSAPYYGSEGGVTSFNNNRNSNKPGPGPGAFAGKGSYHNYGSTAPGEGGGGHTKFTAEYFSPNADHGSFYNYPGAGDSYTAGFTQFSKNTKPKEPGKDYFPTAGHATIVNYAALGSDGSPGYTVFKLLSYSDDEGASQPASGTGNCPTGGNARIINHGAAHKGAKGGYTEFMDGTDAGNAQLYAFYASNKGYGGTVKFSGDSIGSGCSVKLHGNDNQYENGVLDVSYHTGGIKIAALECHGGGTVSASVGDHTTQVEVSSALTLNGTCHFGFWKGTSSFATGTPYAILSAPGLDPSDLGKFTGYLDGYKCSFSISAGVLSVTFSDYSAE